jgi:hypothetical protein
MDTRTTRGLPVRLEGVRQRFEKWRRTRKVRSPIPETLWASAVKMAGTFGLHRTAKTLRVNYYTLKKRVEREAAAASRTPEEDPVTTFFELTPPVASGSCECTMELEDSGGAKMRIRLNGVEAPDLAALSRSFWQSEP